MDQFKGQCHSGTILTKRNNDGPIHCIWLCFIIDNSLVAGMSFCNFGWVFSLAQIFFHYEMGFLSVCRVFSPGYPGHIP